MAGGGIDGVRVRSQAASSATAVDTQQYAFVGMLICFYAVYAAAWLLISPEVDVRSVAWWLEQAMFLAPFAFSVVAGVRAARSLTGTPRVFWTLLSTVNAILLVLEIEYTRSSAMGGLWSATAPFGVILVVLPVIVFGVLVATSSRLRAWPDIVRARMAVSVLMFFVIAMLACYRFAVEPYFSSQGITDVATGMQAAFRMAAGALVIGAGVANLPVLKMGGWRTSDVLVVLGVSIYGLGLVGAPHLMLSEMARPHPAEQWVELAWMTGQYLIGLSALVRIRGTRYAEDVPVRARRQPSLVLAPFIFHSVSIAALLAFAYLAAKDSLPAEQQRLYLAGAVVVGVLLLVRDVLVAAERAMLFRSANTDSETGLGNRRYFAEQVDERLDEAARTGAQVTVGIIGIDSIDRLDATEGSKFAERMMALAAAAIVAAFESDAVVARIDWDSFGVLLPGSAVQNHERIDAARVLAGRAAEAPASAGIAVFPEHGLQRDEIRRAAEGALYWSRFHAATATTVFDPARIRRQYDAETTGTFAQRSQLSTLRALADAVDGRDPWTKGHCRHVAELAATLAQRIGLGSAEVRSVEMAALVHDVGKLNIPAAVLQAPRRLTEDEWVLIRTHSALGERIVASSGISGIENAVRSHHERWDGNGYPDGLSGTDIPLEARILALCDAYDAMVSGRSFQAPLTVSAALQEIDHGIGSQFDPELAEQFIVLVASRELADMPAPMMPTGELP